MNSEKINAILAHYGLRPEPITNVAVANLPIGEPAIALYQASAAAPAYLALTVAEQLVIELGYAGRRDIAGRIKDAIEIGRAGN